MRVLVTGNLGYLGPSVVSALLAAGHKVIGLDSGLFTADALEPGPPLVTLRRDIRDVDCDDLADFEAVVHLAGLSNDPLGMLDRSLTREVNLAATLQLATRARMAGVRRFVFSSSCSVYGAASEPWVDERTTPRPVTAYGETKLQAEQGLAALASARFCTTSVRNATAFGYSPYLRTDLVVNDLVAGAYLDGEVCLRSDGAAWRPLVHVRDIARALTLTLAALPDQVNGTVFNVGTEAQNYTVVDIARAVVDRAPGARLRIAEGATADRRSYRVRFGRVRRLLPQFQCEHDLGAGIDELLANYQRVGLPSRARGVRLAHLQQRLATGELDGRLRPTRSEAVAAAAG